MKKLHAHLPKIMSLQHVMLVFLSILMTGFSTAFAQFPCEGCAPVIQASSGCYQPGRIVVPITVQNTCFTDIAAISLKIDFDDNILDYVSITAPNLTSGTLNAASDGMGHLTISWIWDFISGMNIPNQGLLFNITFDLVPTSNYVSTLTWEPYYCNFANVTQVVSGNGYILCQTANNYIPGRISALMVTATPDVNEVYVNGTVNLTVWNSQTMGEYAKSWSSVPAVSPSWFQRIDDTHWTFTPQTAGTYNLTYQVTDGYGCSTNKTIIIQVSTSTPALSGLTIQSGGTLTVNGNLSISPALFVCGSPITDTRDGKTYNTVLIGTQCWMAKNLNVGTKILGSANQTNNSIIEKYCYNDDENNCNTYGGLYQWDEAMQSSTTERVKGICPTGWHLPTDAEWTTLTTFLGGEAIAGGKMKETGYTHWASPNTGATNSSGFTALPGGYRYYSGSFFNLTSYATFWSSSQYGATDAWFRTLLYTNEGVSQDHSGKTLGLSARCLKDN